MPLIVKPIEETTISFHQYYDFIQEAYAERVEQGIPFVCTTLSEDGLKKDMEGCGVHTYIGVMEESPNDIASTISVAYRHDKEGEYAWYHLVATNNRLKGKGIGTQMLRAMIDMAREEGCGHVELTTAKRAVSAVKFYEKNGFNKIGYYQPLTGGGINHITLGIR